MLHLLRRFHRKKPAATLIYLEIYGINQVIYRVIADNVYRKGKAVWTYGVILEDTRTGNRESILNFSEDVDTAIAFARQLVRWRIRPDGLYHAALKSFL